MAGTGRQEESKSGVEMEGEQVRQSVERRLSTNNFALACTCLCDEPPMALEGAHQYTCALI